jgi:hypothetical protein
MTGIIYVQSHFLSLFRKNDFLDFKGFQKLKQYIQYNLYI